MSLEAQERTDGSSNVVIHDDLRALFRSSRRGQHHGVAPEAAEDVDAKPVEESAPTQTPSTGFSIKGARPFLFSLGPSTDYRLRCDGRRPVSFEGIALVERSVETPVAGATAPVRQEIGLYLSTTGLAYVRIAMIVPDSIAARPVHKVSPVSSSDELDQFIGRYDPAEGWSWIAFDCEMSGEWQDAPVAALRRDFGKLVVAALGAATIRLHPETGSET